MTDFLKELELQMTAAAHRAVAERARPPRVKRWPTVTFVAVAAFAVAVMFALPARRDAATTTRRPAKPNAASLEHTRIGIYNGAAVDGLATPATDTLRKLGAPTLPENPPRAGQRAYSKIYFTDGHAGDAHSVAKALGIFRVGSPLPAIAAGEDYDVVVLLGRDFAVPAKRLRDGFALVRETTGRVFDTPAGPVRAIATGTGLCLQIRGRGGWDGPCVTVAGALAGEAVSAIRDLDGRLVGAAGLVPDGVAAIELTEMDGTTRTLPVGRNLWAIGAEQVVSISYDGTTIPLP